MGGFEMTAGLLRRSPTRTQVSRLIGTSLRSRLEGRERKIAQLPAPDLVLTDNDDILTRKSDRLSAHSKCCIAMRSHFGDAPA
jgi:hypothetical protein